VRPGPEAAASAAAFLSRLKQATAPAHDKLERELGFVKGRLARPDILRFLLRLHGFYAAWEPWLARSGLPEAFLQPRRKLPWVERDLAALGIAGSPAPPRYPHPLGPATPERAMGALYVIEGATLGGQLMRSWLEQEAWMPDGGLAYFNGYGPRTAAMWRAFRDRLGGFATATSQQSVIDAANETFEALNGWICAPEEPHDAPDRHRS
jgi:heme oxygenase